MELPPVVYCVASGPDIHILCWVSLEGVISGVGGWRGVPVVCRLGCVVVLGWVVNPVVVVVIVLGLGLGWSVSWVGGIGGSVNRS